MINANYPGRWLIRLCLAAVLALATTLTAACGSDEPPDATATDTPATASGTERPTSAAGAEDRPTTAPASASGPSSVETDREALIALYNATDGESWNQNSNWLSGKPLGSWALVSTDGDGRVIGLYLERNGLSGEIPPELGSLSKLEALDLSDNGLSGDIPPEIGNLSKLAVLFLNDNRLSGCVPGALQPLTAYNLGGLPFC